MRNRGRVNSWRALVGALAIVFPAVAVTAETQGAPGDRPVVRVGPERAVGGVTREERLDRQAQLHELLMGEMPADFETAPIRVVLNQQDRDLLAEPPQNGKAPLRIGVVKAVAGVEVVRGQAFKRGVVEETEDGGFVWATKVTSPEAQAIRVHFRNFSLPDNAEMYFFSLEGQVDGPYTGRGRNGDGDFWTRSISSESGVILLRFIGEATEADKRRISFVVSDVGHINGRPPSPVEKSHDTWPCFDNVACLIDANCGNAGPAEAAKDAVARMEWIAGCCINTCTGGLLADEVVGQLSGCCGFNCGDECDAGSNSTVDGALAFYFDEVSSILDPQGGGGCTGDPECDDGDACNAAETCVGGACQAGTPPPCQNGDGCCPDGCDSGNDDDCAAGGCINPGGLPAGSPCVDDVDCCNDKCKGPRGGKTCK